MRMEQVRDPARADDAASSSAVERAALAIARADTFELPDVVAHQARRVLRATASALAILTDGELELLASAGRTPVQFERWRRVPLAGDIPIAVTARTGRPLVAPVGMFGDLGGRGGPTAGLCAPLVAAGELVGVLAVDLAGVGSADQPEAALALLGELAAIAANSLERTLRARLYDHGARLELLTAKLVQAIGPDEVASAIVEQGVEALGAFAGTVATLSDDGERLVIAAAAGYPQDVVAAWREFSVDAPYPLAEAVRTGSDVLLESRRAVAAHFPTVVGVGRQVGTSALISMPLVVEGRTLGGIGFSFAAPRRFDAVDRRFIRSLARLCAHALDRAHQTRLRDRTARLQRVTAALARSSTVQEIADVIVTEGVGALQADAGLLVVLDPAREALELVSAAGYPDDLVDRWQRLPLSTPLPLADAVRRGEVIVLDTAADLTSAYPFAAEVTDITAIQSVVELPLVVCGEALGAIGFTFHRPYAVAEEDRTFLAALAELCAQAFDRANLHDRLGAAAQRLRQLLERLQDGIVSVRPDLTVGFANGEARSLLGHACRDGEPLPGIWSDLDLREFARALLAPGASASHARAQSPERIFEVIGIPGEDEAVLVLRDVTRRERQERAERDFIANAAHELRTPLSGITVAVEALQLGAAEVPEQRDRFLGGIARETARLSSLVRALLMLARVQAAPETITRENVELRPLLVEAARQLDVPPGVQVHVECARHVRVTANATLLDAAVRNLGQNASRHTARGTITFSAAELAPGTVEIEVRDTGSGMPEEVRSRVFERFYRFAEDREGFGLGLPLVREMVQALGGDIDVESSPGAGTTVRLTLRGQR
jgi:signal transduction histidine kinase